METGGVEHNGNYYSTDRQSQAMITGAALQMTLDSNVSVNWKALQGFVNLDSNNLITVAQKIREHVQNAFDLEMQIKQDILNSSEPETIKFNSYLGSNP